jgi:hypothetical protein
MPRAYLLLGFLLATCKSSGAPAGAAPPAGSDAGEAEVFARQCVEADPTEFKSVGGSPLVPKRARAVTRLEDGRWLVHIPEQTPTTKPNGRDVYVTPGAAVCQSAPMD